MSNEVQEHAPAAETRRAPDRVTGDPSEHFEHVRYTLSGDVPPLEYEIVSFDAVEELGHPYGLTVKLAARDEHADPYELLGKDVQIELERGSMLRSFAGIVERVRVHDHPLRDAFFVTIEVVPALRALALSRTTRIFQEKSAVEIVQEVLRAELAPYRREVDAEALGDVDTAVRDYCVQYQETHLDFVHRLMEEEGIGYYFEHGERERMVLFHDSRRARSVPTANHGAVPFDHLQRVAVGSESVGKFEPTERLSSNAVTVRDHDWTRSRPTIERSQQIDTQRPRHEVYEHGLARHLTITEDRSLLATLAEVAQSALIANIPATGFGLGGVVSEVTGTILGDFTTDDAERQVRIRKELVARDVRHALGESKVTGFAPGKRFTLTGHPRFDGEYLLVKVEHTSSSERVEELPPGTSPYVNRFECIPLNTAWVPERRTPKPRIHGVQTARVTGPVGMDVHTDNHGRVQAKFTWDRTDDDPAGNHSCWLRVSQAWAGQGFPGIVFTLRVGMEVVVAFIDGDPDRTLVTGCVYNGQNPQPTIQPFQATKSMIRTRTVPHGPGHNEISFEDAMGMERVHIRAQRDLDELVLNDHQTHVKGNQLNVVGGNHNEQVFGDRRLLVGRDRTTVVRGRCSESMLRDHSRDVIGSSHTVIGMDCELVVENGAAVTEVVRGEYIVRSKRAIMLAQDDQRQITLSPEHEETGIRLESDGARIHLGPDGIELRVGASTLTITPERIQVNGKILPAQGPPAEQPHGRSDAQ